MARVTLSLIGLCIAAFIVQLIPGIGDVFFQYLAFSKATTFSMPWTWVTTLFLHGGFVHLFFNMWALFLFGPLLEARIGEKYFLIIYFVAGILGNLGFLLTAPTPLTAGIGASGAIFGIIGTLAMLAPNLLVLVFFAPMPLWLASIFWVVTELAASGSLDNVAHFAHVFGIVVGFAAGWLIKREEGKNNGDKGAFLHYYSGRNF